MEEAGATVAFGAVGDDVGEGTTGAGAALWARAPVALKRAAKKIAPVVARGASVAVWRVCVAGGSVDDVPIDDSMFDMREGVEKVENAEEVVLASRAETASLARTTGSLALKRPRRIERT